MVGAPFLLLFVRPFARDGLLCALCSRTSLASVSLTAHNFSNPGGHSIIVLQLLPRLSPELVTYFKSGMPCV